MHALPDGARGGVGQHLTQSFLSRSWPHHDPAPKHLAHSPYHSTTGGVTYISNTTFRAPHCMAAYRAMASRCLSRRAPVGMRYLRTASHAILHTHRKGRFAGLMVRANGTINHEHDTMSPSTWACAEPRPEPPHSTIASALCAAHGIPCACSLHAPTASHLAL